MDTQFENTFKDIFRDTDSLIGKIENLSRNYEDYYTESLEKMVYDPEPQKDINFISIIKLLGIFLWSSVFFPGFIAIYMEDGGIVERHFVIIFLLFAFFPVFFWFLKRKYVEKTKSNTDLSFLLVSDSIMDLEDLYKNYFLRSTIQTSNYITSTQEIIDFFNSSRVYFDEIKTRISKLPSTTYENNLLLQNIQSEAIEWFTKLLALNIIFLSDWISKSKIEFENLIELTKSHSLSEESKEQEIGRFLLVSLEEQKSYFEEVQNQVKVPAG